MSKLTELLNELCPGGVEYVAAGEIAQIGTGRSDRKDAIEGGEFPFFVRSETVMRHSEYEYDETAIVIPGEGGVGEIFHYVSGKYALHQRAYRVSFTTDAIDTRFAFYHFQANFKRFIERVAVTATVKSIRKPMLTKFPIPVPPLEVQQEIVRVLDAFTDLEQSLVSELELRKKQFDSVRRSVISDSQAAEKKVLRLREAESEGIVKLRRGKAISKKDIAANPGDYPVYSSSGAGNGEFGRYGNYMFDDERISWSVDGGGRLFYRPAHRYSVTNVSGSMTVNISDLQVKYLYYVLLSQWENESFDYTRKAHPSVIREVYAFSIPTIEIQDEVVSKLDSLESLIQSIEQEISLRRKQYEFYRNELLSFASKED